MSAVMIDPDPRKEKPPNVPPSGKDDGDGDRELVEVDPSVWAHWLTALLGGESIGRATLVGDQIRSAASQIRSGKPSPLVALADPASPDSAMGLLHTRPSGAGDCVTVLCGGALGSPHVEEPVCRQFADRVHQRWRQQGIKLGFWSGESPSAEDSGEIPPRPLEMPKRMGFRHLADLSYQSADSATIGRARSQLARQDPPRIQLVPVDPCDVIPPNDSVPPGVSVAMKGALNDRGPRSDLDSPSVLARLVEQTYVGSADCPAINRYRTAQQTLDGYRDSPTYSPEHWYWCVDASTEVKLGCALLSIHRAAGAEVREDGGGNERGTKDVAEIVYMALTPAHRGRGLGREVVFAVVDRLGANCRTIILAVDRANAAAAGMYEKLGFHEVFRERLWFWHESLR